MPKNKLKGYNHGPVAFGESSRNAQDYARKLRSQGYKTKVSKQRFYDIERDAYKSIYLVYYADSKLKSAFGLFGA